MTNEEMAAVLRKAGWRVQEPLTKENCKHPRRIGSGSMGSDGSSKTSWYCPDCHASLKLETPPNQNTQPLVLWQ